MTEVDSDGRVLIVAPAGRDAELLRDALGRDGIDALVCADVSHLVHELSAGVGVVVLTEEALDADSVTTLQSALAFEPPWSDVPILLLLPSHPPAEERIALATAESLGNVMMLRRPVSVVMFLSSVRAALRTRKRQYETRGHLAELHANDRAKDEFLAMLGHELRNPLSAIRNAITTASLDESRRPRALEIAERQTDQLARLVDDLLDVARITHGHITLRKERGTVGEILERSIESSRAWIASRGIHLEVSIPRERLAIDADPARIEQVFANLLSNAVKYTERGGFIAVAAENRDDHAIIRIRDTGIGIAPEMLPRVWELFAQAERGLDRAQGGLGIGLTVARRLVELHGGVIEARSEGIGKGAEFTVCLPLIPADRGFSSVQRQQSKLTSNTHARVLIVEDNSDAAESLEMLLELLGHEVEVVNDGITAVDAARANAPDVVLVDIGLPGIDGYEVARRIRRDPGLKDILLIALTGYGADADKQQASESGFDYHLVKPVDAQALTAIVDRFGAVERSAH